LQEELTEETELLSVEYFTIEFCKVLDLNKKQFAGCLDTDVSNLNKYLKGQRAFSTDLALKFAHFFHTPADVWLKIPLKNELFLIAFEAKDANKYQKYDYEKVACEYR
jgi:plasmid maintenance system antidote protein VapI